MSEMTNSEIKNCPFCGSALVVDFISTSGCYSQICKCCEVSWTRNGEKKLTLNYLNSRTLEPIDSIEKLTKLVSSIALECKKLGLTQVETSNILKHTFSTTEPTKPSYSACHENIEKLKADFDKGWKDWEKWCLFLDSRTEEPKAENGLVAEGIPKGLSSDIDETTKFKVVVNDLKDFRSMITHFIGNKKDVEAVMSYVTTPSITKEQLLATIDKAEKEYYSSPPHRKKEPMPNNEELEKIALKLWCISGREEGFIHHKNLGSSEYIHIMRISAFHIRERDIAVLKGRIEEMRFGSHTDEFRSDRIDILCSQLTALKKESEK